jgi:hypothetical protein
MYPLPAVSSWMHTDTQYSVAGSRPPTVKDGSVPLPLAV